MPVLRFLDGKTIGAHGNEGRQVLIVAAEAVAEPGPEAGADLSSVAAVHEQKRKLVTGGIGVGGANNGDVVNALGNVREEVADLNPALAILAELERRRQSGAGFSFGGQIAAGKFFAGVLGEHRLGIEGIDVGWPTVEEDVNNMLGLGGKVGRLR